MNFTRRTYRVAIKRSIAKEQELRVKVRDMPGWIEWKVAKADLQAQITHTRRLQARKRKERK